MSKHSWYATELLERVKFDFSDYKDIASRTADYCFELSEKYDHDLRFEEVYSERSYVIGLCLMSAATYCAKNKIDASSKACSDIFFDEIYEFINDLTYALTDFDPDSFRQPDRSKIEKAFSLRLPISEYSRLETYLVNENVRHNSKELERLVAVYLSSKFRSDELDSFMFKLLAEEEPVQFVYEMVYKSPFVSDLLRPQLEIAQENIKVFETSVFKNAVIGLFRYSLYSIIIFGAAFLAEIVFFNGEEWPFFVALGLSTIMAVLWFLGLIWFISTRNKFFRTRDENKDVRLINLVHAMSNFFQMLRSSGKLSLDRIEKKLSELEEVGAVMPETLHLFIKDLREKGKHNI